MGSERPHSSDCLDWCGEENQGNQGLERVWEALEWSWAVGHQGSLQETLVSRGSEHIHGLEEAIRMNSSSSSVDNNLSCPLFLHWAKRALIILPLLPSGMDLDMLCPIGTHIF